MHILG